MTPAEIRNIYDQGPEAVIAQVTHLFDIIAEQSRRIEEQSRQIEQLTVRVATLEAQLAKHSGNSSKPPSSDGLKKPAPKSQRDKSGKKPGGQPGHKGATLCWSEQPDQFLAHRPEQCAHCGTALDQAASTTVDRRQVHDLPPMRIQVTEHQVHTVVCPCCRHDNRGVFPEGVVAPMQYGPHIQGLAVYLTCYQLLPFARTAMLLHDLLGVGLNPGTIQSTQRTCAQRLGPTLDQIKAALIQADQEHFDETGARIAGRLHWLHVAATDRFTFYATHPKRGQAAMDQIGILPAFTGRAMHDGWASYLSYPCRHALCNAHHLRELTFLAEEEGFLWAQAMKRLLLDIKDAVDQAKARGQTSLEASAVFDYQKRYQTLIDRGYEAHPIREPSGKRGRTKQSTGRNLVARLDVHRDAALAFLHDFDVAFDNNLAERDVRMMKLRLKISGCFRTTVGADTFCAIRSYLSTMIKQGHNAFQVLTRVMNNQILPPALQT